MDGVVFADGLGAQIQELWQREVYGGLLEGIPNAQINACYIQDDRARAQRLFGSAPVHLIEPAQTPIRGAREGAVMLPKFVCAALFHSHQGAHHPDEPYMYYSEAIIIWYQARLAMPIDADVLVQLQRLSWVKLSRDMMM